MPVSFELRLEERHPDRVIVSVLLAPAGGPLKLGGVAVELFSRTGDSLSPRILLPIAGVLTDPIAVRVELRAHQPPITIGATVTGTAWWDNDQVEASCPAEPWTELEAHVRGRQHAPLRSAEHEFLLLNTHEHTQLSGRFPWLTRAMTSAGPVHTVTSDDATEDLGLDAESAEWLRELLNED